MVTFRMGRRDYIYIHSSILHLLSVIAGGVTATATLPHSESAVVVGADDEKLGCIRVVGLASRTTIRAKSMGQNRQEMIRKYNTAASN